MAASGFEPSASETKLVWHNSKKLLRAGVTAGPGAQYSMILALLSTPLGRKTALVLIVALFIGGAAGSIYYRGRAAEAVAAGQRVAEETRRQAEADKKIFEQRIDRLEKTTEAYKAEVQRSEALAQQAAIAVQEARLARAAAARTVSAVPDAAILADLIAKLNLREQADATPALHPREMRAVDEIVTDYPLLKAENTALGQRMAALEGTVGALKAENQAVAAERDAWKARAYQIEGHYVRIYNAFPRKGNRFLQIITFGRYGKAKKLPYPSPTDLAGAPEAK